MRILVIDDEVKTSAFLKKGFSERSITADVAGEGEEGLHRALTGEYDLIILDVMLPKLDGWSVIAELRKRGKETPVIMLTARDAVPDRIRGLELGVDDYLVKPISFLELYARIRTILRRGSTLKQEVLRVADLEVDLVRQRATRGGKRLDLTQKEFAILSLFVRKSGEVISKIRIAEQVWNTDFDSFAKIANIIDVHMAHLRAKVDDPFEKKLIYTIRGMGYVLEER
jgi:two-component system copper resistance phosphate regulon response regulator CusR